jgi:hypothetical protein
MKPERAAQLEGDVGERRYVSAPQDAVVSAALETPAGEGNELVEL